MALTDWGRRCALVIQAGQVTDNEVNFPLLVTEDTLPSEIFDADGSYPALNGGGDIRFSSDEAGNTQLACEIESFITDNDPANGKAAIWVKVPSLSSSTNTTIYIWYNKTGESQPAEDNAYGKENVWDAFFKMVQHMNQTPDGTADEMVDSTSNDNDGTTYNMDSADQVAGQIDGSLDFDGGDDYVDCGNGPALAGTGPFTLNVQLKVTDTSGDTYYILSQRNPGYNGEYMLIIDPFGDILWQLYNNGFQFNFVSGFAVDDNIWHSIIATRETDGSANIYIDGILKNSFAPAANKFLDSSFDVVIGKDKLGEDYFFNGIIDEVRISNVARSAGWIATEYNNQKVPWTFLVEGTPETPGAAPSIFIPQIIMF